MSEGDDFSEFVGMRSIYLLRSAWLLTGNEASAQDLVQATLAKAWTRWGRIASLDSPEAYVRKIMLSLFLTWSRRRWNGEVATAELADVASDHDDFSRADLRSSLLHALRALPRRQRAVVVLRYFDDLTEAQVADVLGCSIGTVKSHNARALGALRISPALIGLFDEEEVP